MNARSGVDSFGKGYFVILPYLFYCTDSPPEAASSQVDQVDIKNKSRECIFSWLFG